MDKSSDLKFKTVDEYLASLPEAHRSKLVDIRKIVNKIVPEADEIISYNMPAYKYYGLLLYLAAHKNHIGFYPGSTSSIIHFKNDLKAFHTSKGTIQFQINEQLPIALIKKIIQFRVKENTDKAIAKGKIKK